MTAAPSENSEVYSVRGIPGLFFGSLQALAKLGELGITHIVSVVNFEPSIPQGDYSTLHICIEDAEEVNLLQHLPVATEFIDNALSSLGRVLIHCNAGRSRSVSVAMAYLMAARGLDADTALQHIRERCPNAEPNDGFASQLQLWQYMSYRLDESCGPYKYFLLQQVGQRWTEEGYLDPAAFGQMPDDGQSKAADVLFRCRKCRKLLASSDHVIPTDWIQESTHSRFRRQRQPAAKDAAESESSVFLQPMVWMREAVTGTLQGKLYCPGCNARLGSFNWSGIRNTSGHWVTPAFQLHNSKVDAIDQRPGPELAGLRHPLVGPAAAKFAASTPQQHAAGAGLLPSHTPPSPPEQCHGHESPGAAEACSGSGAPLLPSQASCDDAGPSSLHSKDAAGHNGCNGIAVTGGDSSPSTSNDQHAEHVQHASEHVQQAVIQAQSAEGPTTETLPDLIGADSATTHRRRFDFLIFDCDGVLVDSERASCESLRLSILEVTGFDIPHEFPQDYEEVFGMDVRSCVQHYQQKFQQSHWGDVGAIAANVSFAKDVIYKRLTAQGVPAFEGAARLIQEARALGLAVGVGSSGAPEKIRHNLQTSGLAGLLDWQHVVSAAQVQRGKPAPDVYLEVMRRLGCSQPSRAIIVEDAVNGLLAGRAAGAFLIGVASSVSAQQLHAYADLVVERLNNLDLNELLQQTPVLDCATGPHEAEQSLK